MASWSDVADLVRGLPDAVAGHAHEGSPAYDAGRHHFARLRYDDEGRELVQTWTGDLGFADARRSLYGPPQAEHGQGVKVAVIDTGVGPHADLHVARGRNTTLVEPVDQWHDEDGHVTHVAGVIAAYSRGGANAMLGEDAADVLLLQ